ncbi:MAG: hypothetical protein F2563_02250 [Actinobacteria bacterium]|nr:hypothetical protein [Actinomycetota bacterium]
MAYSLEEVSRIIRASTYSLDSEIVERINDCLNGIAETFNPSSSRAYSGSKAGSPRSRPTYAWKVLDTDTEAKIVATIVSKLNKVGLANVDKIIEDIALILEDKNTDIYNKIGAHIFENIYGILDLNITVRILLRLVELRAEFRDYLDTKSREWLSMVQSMSDMQAFDPEDEKDEYCEQDKKKGRTKKFCDFISLVVKNNVVSSRVIWDYTDTVIANVIKHRADYEMREFNTFRVSCLCSIATILIESDAGGFSRLCAKLRELLEQETEDKKLGGYALFQLRDYFSLLEEKSKPVVPVTDKPAEEEAKPLAWTSGVRTFNYVTPAPSPTDPSSNTHGGGGRRHAPRGDSDWQPVNRKGGKKKSDGKIGSGMWRKG